QCRPNPVSVGSLSDAVPKRVLSLSKGVNGRGCSCFETLPFLSTNGLDMPRICESAQQSFGSDPGTGDYSRELSCVRAHELRKLPRRASHRFISQIEHPLTNIRQSKYRDDFAMEPLNDFVGRARRDEEALPTDHIEARHGFGNGRHFGQDRRTLHTRDRERANLARLYVGQGGRY